jgi:hypothetical protein
VNNYEFQEENKVRLSETQTNEDLLPVEQLCSIIGTEQ